MLPTMRLEVLFNPEGQQRGGASLAMRRALGGRPHALLDCLARGPFNANPVLAGYLLGCLASRAAAEPEMSAKEAERTAARVRGVLAPPVSGIGDRLFWGGVRPVLTAAALVVALLTRTVEGGLAAVCVYLVGFNVLQAYWRRRSWRVGRRGEDAVRSDCAGILRSWSAAFPRAGRFLLGLAAGLAFWSLAAAREAGALGLFAGAAAVGFMAVRHGKPGATCLGWIAVAASVGAALARAVAKEVVP